MAFGTDHDLDWYRNLMKKFEFKARGRIGPDIQDQKSTRILNRVIEWTSEGIKYEMMDQRHAEIILSSLGICESKSAATPGIDLQKKGSKRLGCVV